MGGEQRFFSVKDAATFCGYSKSYFVKLVRDSGLPRYGNASNRFDREDLVKWGHDKNAFKVKAQPAAPRKLLPKPEV